MMHKDCVLNKMLLTEPLRAKASLHYELRSLEAKFSQLIKIKNFDGLVTLCQDLIDRYLVYLTLLGEANWPNFYPLKQEQLRSRDESYHLLSKLKRRLHCAPLTEEKNIVRDIIALYDELKQAYLASGSALLPNAATPDAIYDLFLTGDVQQWFIGLIHCWNQNLMFTVDFQSWTKQQLLYAQDFFASTPCVHLINALFFYKLMPEQLAHNAHAEKLLSLHSKVERLHVSLIFLRQQLYDVLASNDLKPAVDFLCHNSELPAGVKFKVYPAYHGLILDAVNLLRTTTPIAENKLTMPTLIQEVFAAYKFSFNPSRLIDATMLLRQMCNECGEGAFKQKMLNVYQQLSTTQCLDLYGYFSNQDTHSLLHSFLADWPSIRTLENKALMHDCYSSLQIMMDSLRVELENRALYTAPYHYELITERFEMAMDNQQAILRLLEVYSFDAEQSRGRLEQLFADIENS